MQEKGRRTRLIYPIAGRACMLAAVDQLTKHAAGIVLKGSDTVPLIPGILHLTLVHNTGSAFGLFRGMSVLFVIVSFAVILMLVYLLCRGRVSTPATGIAVAYVLGGACGNLIDRVRIGHVIDFIDLRVWPVFNIADMAITAGVIMYIISLVRDRAHASDCLSQ